MNIIRIHCSDEAVAASPPDLFGLMADVERFSIEVPAEVANVLGAGAPVFVGVSGGRDSQALAYRVCAHLDDIGHQGRRFLIHADLGRVDWRDSLPVCERLAHRLGVELVVVRRNAGDMMDRWLSRWAANVARYANLECVKLILPWSTAAQRFCTAELKSQVIAREMRRRFPEGDVVSAVGIRREESTKRARMPAWKQDERTTRRRGAGHTWNPLLGSMAARGSRVRSACSARSMTFGRRATAPTTMLSTARWWRWKPQAPSRSRATVGSATWLRTCSMRVFARGCRRPRSVPGCG